MLSGLIGPTEFWLFVGIVLIIFEFSHIPGIGLLFVGLGAISTAFITNYWPEQTTLSQIAYVGSTALLWFVCLWYPLKLFVYQRKTKVGRESFDLRGSQVTVINKNIKAGEHGQVSWSGTIMNAQFIDDTNNVAKVDDTIYVLEVQGNKLICGNKLTKIK